MQCFNDRPHRAHDWWPGAGPASQCDGYKIEQWVGTDGERWAIEFARRFGRGFTADDARTWFANAIEAGRDAGSRTVADIDPHTIPAGLIDGLATLAHNYGGYRQIGEVARWISQR